MPRKSERSSGSPTRLFDLYLGPSRLCLGRRTKIMGILNVTPDSFFDGGLFKDPGRAQEQALKMEREGADLVDVGGESSRPGSRPISARDEIARVVPVLRRLAGKIKIPVSVDTTKYEVVCAALDAGAVLINDISALGTDRRTARRIARYKAGIVLMHMPGTPLTMQSKTRYRDLFGQIRDHLRKASESALAAGVRRDRIVIDPGFGFGKTAEQNIRLLAGLGGLAELRFPVLVGLSRKSFIGHPLVASREGIPVSDRLFGSLAAAAAAIERGAHILRVHDVLAHCQLARLIDRVRTEKNS